MGKNQLGGLHLKTKSLIIIVLLIFILSNAGCLTKKEIDNSDYFIYYADNGYFIWTNENYVKIYNINEKEVSTLHEITGDLYSISKIKIINNNVTWIERYSENYFHHHKICIYDLISKTINVCFLNGSMLIEDYYILNSSIYFSDCDSICIMNTSNNYNLLFSFHIDYYFSHNSIFYISKINKRYYINNFYYFNKTNIIMKEISKINKPQNNNLGMCYLNNKYTYPDNNSLMYNNNIKNIKLINDIDYPESSVFIYTRIYNNTIIVNRNFDINIYIFDLNGNLSHIINDVYVFSYNKNVYVIKNDNCLYLKLENIEVKLLNLKDDT